MNGAQLSLHLYVLPLFDLPPLKLTEIVVNALSGGAVVIAANSRAARALTLNYADRQRASGLVMWSSAAITDWDTWLNHLWQEHAFSQPDAPLLLTHLQEHSLWIRVQQNDARLVVSPDGLASLAQTAYAHLSDYKLHQERSSVWLEIDSERFRAWAKTFDQLCRDHNWSSRSNLETLLVHATQDGTLTLPKQVLLVGFDRFTPSQQQLLQHFRDAGVSVDVAAPAAQNTSPPALLVAQAAREELFICAEWCRYKLEKNPSIRIGVVAPDISSISAEADRIFRAILMPQALDIASESAPMPFEFSLGVPLSTVPIISAALLFLRWVATPLLEEDISWLLLSGLFNSSHAEITDLAQLDFTRRDSGALSPEVSLKVFVDQYRSNTFSRRMKQVLRVADSHALDGNRTFTYWSGLIEQILSLSGWPGFRSADSVQFQAQRRWLRLLDEIALLDFDGRKVTFSAFLQILNRQANETTFIPESHQAPIQILGAFESSGQTFDAIWFLGIDDVQWPPIGRPHPLLPIALQRRAQIPHSDMSADTEFTLTITERITKSAQECVFSYRQQSKEGERRPSPILAMLFGTDIQTVSTVEFRRQMGLPEPPIPLSQAEAAVSSSQVAPWPVERIAGGAEVLKDQAACPFRAFGKRRLVARPLNRTDWGLDAAQRGSLLHTILEAIWSPETTGPFRIVSLDDLKSVIAAQRLDEVLRYHIEGAFSSLVHEHAEDVWMQAYLESEQQRLLVRLSEWMLYEAKRQPFVVHKREEKLTDVKVGDLRFNLRADRIDKLPDDSHLLIDYKTSEVSASAWKGDRPDEPQLPLYAAYGNVERVSGLLFAQIRAGKTGFVGRVANCAQSLLPDLTATSSLLNQPYDEKMHDEWQETLLSLAEEFLRGEASVDPKHRPDTCTYCPLPGLCRIAEVGLTNETDDTESDYV